MALHFGLEAFSVEARVMGSHMARGQHCHGHEVENCGAANGIYAAPDDAARRW